MDGCIRLLMRLARQRRDRARPAPQCFECRFAAVPRAARAPAVGGRKVGSIGYCMGGRLAYLAASIAGVGAAVAKYGGGIHAQLDRAGAVACAMQFHDAQRDDRIPTAAVDQVRTAMRRAEVHVYPGALHGFNCRSRGS